MEISRIPAIQNHTASDYRQKNEKKRPAGKKNESQTNKKVKN